MKAFLIIILLLISTICFSAIHTFYDQGSCVYKYTFELFNGNIAVDTDGSFLLQRWPIGAEVHLKASGYLEESLAPGIFNLELANAVHESIDKYNVYTNNSSSCGITLVYHADNPVIFKFSDNPDHFVADPNAAAIAFTTSNINTNEILSQTYVLLNKTSDYLNNHNTQWDYGGDCGAIHWICLERVIMHEISLNFLSHRV